MIETIHIKQFRSYSDEVFSLSPTVTIISGPNGSGKTNILEALHVACQGNSFRGASSEEMLSFYKDWWRIDAKENGVKRSVTYNPSKPGLKKKFIIGSSEKSRLQPQQAIPVVVFEPNDLRLLHGSPARRREFLDNFISQLNPLYKTTLNRYERALKQRNNLLKNEYYDQDNLFVWDMTLSELGATIIKERHNLITLLNDNLTEAYQSVSMTKDEIKVVYETQIGTSKNIDSHTLQQQLLSLLHANHRRDHAIGHTTTGPHRDDVSFHINNHDASQAASRGETRTIVLALKFLEMKQLKNRSDRQPLLLLDDVFSELDSKRRRALTTVARGYQIVITTTDADLSKSFKRKTLKTISLK